METATTVYCQDSLEDANGFIAICAWCDRVRDKDGYWRKSPKPALKKDLSKTTHVICPDCSQDFLSKLDN